MIRQIKSAFKHARGLAQLRSDDVWLASYPRSGNSRLRMLLGQAQLLTQNSKERCIPGNVEEIMPVWGFSDLSKFPQIPRFVKTHRMYLPIMSRPQRTVFVLRDPHESIASAYRMYCSRKNVGKPVFDDFLKHPRHGLPGWIRMHRSWMPRTTFIVHYKDLMADAAETVHRMCEKLSVDYSEEIILKAAEMTDHKNAANAEQNSGIRDANRFDGSFKAVGPGNHVYAAELFQESHLAYVAEELLKANIETDDHVGHWKSKPTCNVSEPDFAVRFFENHSVDTDKIVEFFQRSNVESLNKTFRAFDLSADQARWISQYEGQDNYFFAMAGEGIAGFGMLRGWDEGYEVPSLGLFVSPDHQGKGVGKAIMNHLTKVAVERGCQQIRLTVDADNERAVALYMAQLYERDIEAVYGGTLRDVSPTQFHRWLLTISERVDHCPFLNPIPRLPV